MAFMTDAFAKLDTGRCISCGSCTEVCPSARNGGFVPDEFIELINGGGRTDDVWRCLQCRRCSDACPQGIDVAEAVSIFRNAEASNGNIPERFVKTSKAFLENGTLAVYAGRMVAIRADLGLPEPPLTESPSFDGRSEDE